MDYQDYVKWFMTTDHHLIHHTIGQDFLDRKLISPAAHPVSTGGGSVRPFVLPPWFLSRPL